MPILHIFVSLMFFTIVLTSPSGFSNEKRYSVFLGDGPLTPLVAFSPPLPKSDLRTKNGEPQVLSNNELPLMLCGASIVSEKQLLTSIRCSPSIASKAKVYVFPAGTRDYLSQLDEARVLEKVVADVLFKHKHTLTSGITYRNVAIITLDDNYFSPSINLLENNKVTEASGNNQTTSENLAVANLDNTNQTKNESQFIEQNYDIHETDYESYYDYESIEAPAPTNTTVEVAGGTHEGEETFTAVEVLDLTSSLIDVTTVAEEAQQNMSSSINLVENNEQYKTTTPLCTLREEYEDHATETRKTN